jgi:PAS domain S-box-containing protein
MRQTMTTSDRLGWQTQPWAARVYVAAVILAGVCGTVAFFPRQWPPPMVFAVLVAASCLTSAWKVNLPIPLSSSSTLSVSYAAGLMALLLLGPKPALVVALIGAWTQCTVNVKEPYPIYRTVFSVAAMAVTMVATGVAYTSLGGRLAPHDFHALSKPLVGAIAAYFVVNTVLVAGAIAFSTGQSLLKIWREDFLWSAASFLIAGSAGAGAAVIIARGGYWSALLMMAPVYFVYSTYRIFVGRLDDERRHVQETRRLHGEAVAALLQARQSEQALAEEKERLMVTLRSIGDGVIATDMDGTILLIDDVAEALTGWTREQAVGRPLASVFQNVDLETRERFDNSMAALTASSEQHGRRRCSLLVARDLTERPIEECAAPVCDAEGRTIGMVLAFRDITDALRIQEERAKAGKLASLGLLAGGIAHDFNNILTGIMGNISLARATTPRARAAGTALAEAEQACVRARQLTWQLLTFSKGGVPARKTVAVARILDEAAALSLRGSNVTSTIEIAPDLWTFDADEGQLIQVFTNVLINAQQAMPHGGVIAIRAENVFESTPRSEHALRVESGPYVRVSVADKGLGIPREHLARIFDPYFSTKQRGSGLGLATTYSIVKNHGGFVTVDSQLGRGTTMEIHFPAAIGAERRAPAVVPSRRGRHRVLFMDDDASNRTLAANMLEFLGYDVEVVEGGSAAVDRFKSALGDGCPFDAVMLDLLVPGDLGAREAIEHLAGLDPAINAILVSGYAQDAIVNEFRDYGFKAVITKPFTLQELSATLESVITVPTCRVH